MAQRSGLRGRLGPLLYVVVAAVLSSILLAAPESSRRGVVLGILVGALVCVCVGILVHRPPARTFWWLVAGALALWVVGRGMRLAATELVGPWDAVSLTGYLSLLAAVLVLGRGTWGRSGNLLDTGIVTIAVGGTLLCIVIEPALRGARLSTLETAVLLGYPLLGTLLFAGVLRCAFGPISRSFAITALLIGLAMFAVTTAFIPGMLFDEGPPTYLAGIGWVVGYVSLAAAALDPSMKRVVASDDRTHPVGRLRLAALGGSIILLPAGVLMGAILGHPYRRVLVLAVGVPLAALVALRVLLLVRAVERRARAFDEERRTLMVVIRNLPLAIWTTDLDGNITFSDGKAIGRLGYGPGELVGRHYFDLYAYQPDALADHKRALEGQGNSRTIQFGDVVWEAYISPLRDQAGEITGILGVALDITDRVRSVERLAERELLLRQAEQIANIGSWSWDIDKDVVTWSDQLYRIFGTQPGLLTPTLEGVLAYFHADDRDRVGREIALGLDGGAFTFEARIVRGDGENRYLHCRGETVYMAGAAVGMFGVAQDVTETRRDTLERKELEEQLRQTQKMEAVGRLAGGIAHDFNNLLTAIMGHAGLLLARDDLSHEIRDDIQEIEEAAGAGRDITSALLDIGQRRVLEKRHLELNAVVVGFEPVLRRLIGEDVTLEMELSDRELFVKSDQGQLEQVMLNLAVNAREAMPGGGRLTIRTEETTQPPRSGKGRVEGPWVTMSFTDTGLGIDPGHVERIFDPFYSTKEGGRSTGLGLSIVYGIIQESSGFIDVTSAPNNGTQMRVFLPLSVPTESPTEMVPKTEPAQGPATILLVEDERAVRATTQRILSRSGYSVLTAIDGPSALEIATSDIPIDLLVTDVVMPKMNGVALAERFLEFQPRAQIIYISGYTADVLNNSGLSGGRIDFVAKPFRPDELVAKVREVLGRHPEVRR